MSGRSPSRTQTARLRRNRPFVCLEPRITPEPRYRCARARRTFEAGGDIHPLPEDIVVLEDVSGRDADAEFDAVGGRTPLFRLTMPASLAQRSAAGTGNSG